MDNSEQYIKMCKEAKEIQKLCPLSKPNEKRPLLGYGRDKSPCHFINNTWIPRQDQLQEMLSGEWMRKLVSLYDFAFEYSLSVHPYCWNKNALEEFKDGGDPYESAIKSIQQTFNSMEQLWLAFVMESLYNKKWNGKAWIT